MLPYKNVKLFCQRKKNKVSLLRSCLKFFAKKYKKIDIFRLYRKIPFKDKISANIQDYDSVASEFQVTEYVRGCDPMFFIAVCRK